MERAEQLATVRERVGVGADEELPAFTTFGGCPLIYVDNEHHILCAKCANLTSKEDFTYSFWPVDVDVLWELTEQCSNCDGMIIGAYGNDDLWDAVEEE